MTEREQNVCTTLCCVSATLCYVTIRCSTVCCVAAASHNVAQRDDSEAMAWRQRSITRFSQRDYSEATTWLARGDNVAPYQNVQYFQERGDQKRGTTRRPKSDTVTGTLVQYGDIADACDESLSRTHWALIGRG